MPLLPRWELKHTADPLDRRAYGGGGDGGMGQMRADEEARQRKVQAAVDAINAKFGYGQGRNVGPRPSREAFTTPASPGGVVQVGTAWAPKEEYQAPTAGGFNQAGYDAALAKWRQQSSAAKGEVNASKVARNSMYAQIADAVKSTALRDLDRQYTKASQKNLFGLARSGLLGGSVDAESGGELQELYGEGQLKATQAGQQASSDLRGNDEQTRQRLIGLAQSGLDTGTAASMASAQMGAAADLARSQAAQATVGRLFDDLGQAYLTNQYMRSRYTPGVPGQPMNPYGYSGFSSKNYVGTNQG